jgi:hypothetical protein
VSAGTPHETTTGHGRQEGPGGVLVSRGWIVVLVLAAFLLSAVVLYTLWAFWPNGTPLGATGQRGPTSQRVSYFGWQHSVSHDRLFFVVIALAGALGGLLHTVRSITWYVGNRRLFWSWIPFNLMLPVVGALGGTIFYLVLRAGLFAPSASTDDTSPYGFAAVAVLVGLFSEQALEKLRQVAANLFAESPKGADHVDPEKKETKPADR